MVGTVTSFSGYGSRVIDSELDELLTGLPAVSIEGPKAVGKTATAQRRAKTEYLLDRSEVIDIVRADPTRLLRGDEPVLIDEWQLYPDSWNLIRRDVDDDPSPNRYLLTGSASPTGAPTHSGAGRIVPLRMRPMSLHERGIPATVSLATVLSGRDTTIEGSTAVGLSDYVTEILTGGFPALRGLPERALRAQLDGYLERVIDRDFPEQGLNLRHPDTLRAWMRAYAAATSTISSYEVIRDAATPGIGNKPARTTTIPYRDVLSRLWLLDPVPAWLPTNNRFRQLGAAEKHHLADPALAARLLNATEASLLSVDGTGDQVPHPGGQLGALFESLIALNLRIYAQAAQADVRHLRTHRGNHEVDFIITGPDGGIVAIEVKLAANVGAEDLRHLTWLREQLGDQLRDAIILTTGSEAYRRRDGIAVVPAALLGP